MSGNNKLNQSDLDELLAARALGDLSPDEEELLNRSLREHPEMDTDEFDIALAALVAGVEHRHQLPDDVADKIKAEAGDYLRKPLSEHAAARSKPTTETSEIHGRELFAWLFAVACSILILVLLVPKKTESSLSLVDQRKSLLQQQDAINPSWQPGLHPFAKEVQGDVVWSNSKQQGFMRFVNMPVNDPTKEQYQLWIIDPERDDEPIDGGVFDIPKSGEVLIPITAKLQVLDPKAFAITIEKPGGVVVSTQERLPLIAKDLP